MKHFVTTAIFFTTFQTQANCGFDRIISFSTRVETKSCTTRGQCYAYDINPVTGEYDYFYGSHSDCEGTARKLTEDFVCEREDRTTYTSSDEGTWGFCEL